METLELKAGDVHFVGLQDDVHDRHFAKYFAEININWGRLEYWLYRVLEGIDLDRGQEWTEKFLRTEHRKEKERTVRKEIFDVIGHDAEFKAALEKAFNALQAVCVKRNVLVHGLWRRVSPKVFEVQPLRWDRSRKRLADQVQITFKEIVEISRAMEQVVESLASLSTELMAHQFLSKLDSRRRKRLGIAGRVK